MSSQLDHAPQGEIGLDSTEDETDALTGELVQAIAALEEVPETDVGPLYESVELESVVTLLRHASAHDSTVNVEFEHEGYTITIGSDGTVRIYEGDPQIGQQNESA